MDYSFAAKDVARTFYAHGSHVMLVQGPKPHDAEVTLVEREPGAVSLMMTAPLATQTSAPPDTYYLVKPVFAQAPMHRAITLLHRAGCESVPVEPLSCGACPCGTGCSQAFNLDEAFQDALRQLPIFNLAPRDEALPLVDVVAIGAIYGGFSGFSHLFVRVQAAPGADPTRALAVAAASAP
jgi:hypothetical protein